MTAEEHVPVLIVGGGPTGLVLSALLSRHGVDSTLIERNLATTDHPRAHVVNTRSMEIFRQLGVDASIRAAALPPRASGFVRWVRSLDGPELACLRLAPPPDEIASRVPLSPVMPASCAQDRIEPLLAEIASKGPGHVEFGAELVGLEADADHAVARVRTDAGERVVRAQWVVGCDGASSPTRQHVGIAMEGPDALARAVGIYFHADLSKVVAARPAVLYWTIDADSPGTFIAMDGASRWVFHAAWDADRVDLESFDAARCKQIVNHAVGFDADPEIRSVRPWTMTAQVASRYRAGRVLLAGDAAHRFPPTGGFGMNTGVQDAHNLAWKLAAVLDGRAGIELIDTYEAERRPVGRSNCEWSARNAAGLAQVIGPGAARQADRLERGEVGLEALSTEIQALAEREAGHFSAPGRDLGFVYGPEGALVDDGVTPLVPDDPDRIYWPHAKPGARAPHFDLVRDGAPTSSLDLFEGRFTLLAGSDAEGAWRRAADAQDVPVDALVLGLHADDPAGVFRDLYAVDDGAVLVRPDGHVAWRSRTRPDDAETALRGALDIVLRRT